MEPYRRVKKRVFVVLSISLLILALPILMLYSYSTNGNKINTNNANFTVQNFLSNQKIHGLGFDLEQIDEGNFLLNNSFEPLVYRQNLFVNSGDSSRLQISMPDDPQVGVYPKDFFLGAKATITGIDSAGNRKVKKTGLISEYLPDQIDRFHMANLPVDMPSNLDWQVILDEEQNTYIGGAKGYILLYKSQTDSVLTQLPSELKVTGLFKVKQQIFAMDYLGNVFCLRDNQSWEFKFSANELDLNLEYSFDDLPGGEMLLPQEESNREAKNNFWWNSAASFISQDGNESFMLVGQEGHYIYSDTGQVSHKKFDVEKDINAIHSNFAGYYLVGDDNFVTFTNNGEQFRYFNISEKTDWLSISLRGSEVLIGGSQGQVVSSQDGLIFKNISNEDIRRISIQASQNSDNQTIVFNPNFISCSILSNKQMILIDDLGVVYYSDNEGENWQETMASFPSQEAKKKLNLIKRLSGGQLLAANQQGEIMYALMGLSIELDSPLENGSYQNGDLVQIEQLSNQLAFPINHNQINQLSGEWFVSHPDHTEIKYYEETSDLGRSGLSINLDRQGGPVTTITGLYSKEEKETKSSDGFILEQEIDQDLLEKFSRNRVFNYEIWAKSNQNIDMNVRFSNLNIELEPTTNVISGDWKKYQGILLLPKNSIAEDKTPSLTIEFKGRGEILLDQLSLKSSSQWTSNLKSNDYPKTIDAPLLRLSFCKIGNGKYPSESWQDPSMHYSFLYQSEDNIELLEQTNLVRSLEFLKTQNANPWLVIDSQASSSELMHLMQYLFGLESDYYGNLRLKHGALSRYNQTFDQIYFEIVDTDGIFINDIQKQSYVDWVIATIMETPEYLEIKNRLVFIDGMTYKENILYSNADFHASEFVLNRPIKDQTDIAILKNQFFDLFPRDLSQSIDGRSSFIRSLEIATRGSRLSDVVLSSLSLLGQEKEASLLNMNLSTINDLDKYSSAYTELGKLVYGKSPMEIKSNIEQDKIHAFAYGKLRERVVVLINISDENANAQISNIDLESFIELSYAGNGDLLEHRELKKENQVFSLLPGQVTILYGEEDGK